MRQAHQAQAVDEARENDQPDRKRPNPRKLFKSPMRDPDLRIGLVRHWLKEQPGERGNSADPYSRRQHVDDVAQPVERSGPPFGCAGMARPDQRGDSHRRRSKQPVSCKVWASAKREGGNQGNCNCHHTHDPGAANGALCDDFPDDRGIGCPEACPHHGCDKRNHAGARQQQSEQRKDEGRFGQRQQGSASLLGFQRVKREGRHTCQHHQIGVKREPDGDDRQVVHVFSAR